MRVLIVLAGPIGAGKSTVADLLGRRLAEAGSTVAVVDLDDVAFMQRDIAPGGAARSPLQRSSAAGSTPAPRPSSHTALSSSPEATTSYLEHSQVMSSRDTFFFASRYRSRSAEWPVTKAVEHRRTPTSFEQHTSGSRSSRRYCRTPDFVLQAETLSAEAIADAIAAGLRQA